MFMKFYVCILACVFVFAGSALAQQIPGRPAAPAVQTAQPARLAVLDATDAGNSEEEEKSFFYDIWDNFVERLFSPQIQKPFSVGVGTELTQNARKGLVPEVFAAIDYDFDRFLAFGVRGGMTYGADEPKDSLISVMEGVFFSRFYVYDFGWVRPYTQVGFGVSSAREVDFEVLDVLGEGAVGGRAHFLGWFADISFRWGYPFRTAFGIEVGHSFLP
jgi:hypothetical protein